jgi:hypothetical protein
MTKKHDVDMSAEAIAQRLEQLRALYKLALSLRDVRPVTTSNGAAG